MLIVFCICLAAIVWVYFAYPLALWLGVLRWRKPFAHGGDRPLVSVIIAARNEEPSIQAKLENVLASDYPRDRVEILVGSDGSSDRTEEIVREFAAEGVGLISFPQQQGKSAIQNGLAAAATGAILVFTDADCLFSPGALGCIVGNFADPGVGLVTARPRYENASETSVTENESLYLRYETWLRRQESERGLLAMASGSLFAMRRSLWRPLDPNLGDDFAFPLKVAEAGMRNVLEPRATALTRLPQNQPHSMLRMKVRIISKDLRALLAHRALLNPMRHGALAASLWSHKLLRWLVPYALLGMLASNFCLLERPCFRAALALQAAFYLAALAGFAWRGHTLGFPWSIPMSFCLVNFAALLGTLTYFTQGDSGRWEPERNGPATARTMETATHSSEWASRGWR